MVTADTALTIGVIGTGNMGAALVRGWSQSPVPPRMIVWDKVPAALRKVADCEGAVVAGSPAELAAAADILILVVKPKDAAGLLSEVGPALRPGQVVISSMAGVELAQLRAMCGPAPVLFRVMPNLGVEVGAGTVAVAAEPGVSQELERQVVGLFGALGLAAVVPESMMDAVTAVSGTGPALLALALEGLEDGGVAAGLTRSLARTFARRALLGAARMLADTGSSAAELSESLTPAGDPLRKGAMVVEERAVRVAFEHAVEAASERARRLRAPSAGGS